MAPPIRVVLSLYRSLLRASKPFSPPSPSYAAYASLLHRSGIAHDWESCVERQELNRRAVRRKKEKAERERADGREHILPHRWARNLTRSYDELREEYDARKDFYDRRFASPVEDDYWDDDAAELGLGEPIGATINETYVPENDPAIVLFRHLLREWFAGGEDVKGGHSWPWNTEGTRKQIPLLRFPSQILNGGGISVRDLIRREFRAPSAEEGRAPNKYQDGMDEVEGKMPVAKEVYPPSSYIDDGYRIQTAFRALAELNRKLAFANAIGLPASDDVARQERDWKRLIQAAKGVSHFPPVESEASLEEALSEELLKGPSVVEDQPSLADEQPVADDAENGIASESNGDATASDTDSPDVSSSPLRCGTYLVAHPLMAGYFARSVIVILDHTEEGDGAKKKAATAEESGESPTTEENGNGGTYGLIINRLALQQPEQVESSRRNLELMRMKWELSQIKKDEIAVGEDVLQSSNKQEEDSRKATVGAPPIASTEALSSPTESVMDVKSRPFSLLEAINAFDLPESVQDAFGDAPIRDGGPVNLSLQMIHRNTRENDGDETLASAIGGTLLPAEYDHESDDAIYFGGNAIKASRAVLDGDRDQDDFSFVVGASCWAPDQLENEIERGCWLPFRGPASMALTGMVDHSDVTALLTEDGDDTEKESKLSPFPPRPSNASSPVAGSAASKDTAMRPAGDLWLSVMCALGEQEADLAFVLGKNNVTHEFGDACDNADRG